MICDWMARWARYCPNKIALKEHTTQRTLSYLQINELANLLSSFLIKEYNLTKGDRIVILAENCLEYFLLFSAAQKTGLVLVPINYRLTNEEIRYLLSDAEPSLIICEDKYTVKLNTNRYLNITDLVDLLEGFKTGKNLKGQCDIEVSENDPIFILYTSGTTGFPKGALYTHKMLFWNSVNTMLALEINSESRTLHCLPPFHTGGWNVLTTPILHHGGFIYVLKRFDSEAVLGLLRKEKITLFMGVPTMLKKMSEEFTFQELELPDFKYMIVGGEQMPIPLIEKWHKKNIPIRQGFGMTEVGPNLTSLHQSDAIRKQGSIGRPNFYVQTRIVNENGKQTDVDEPGELLLYGPMVTPGYWRNAEATSAAFSGKWFRSGDMVKRDNEGFLFVVDRLKNMFISGGENVYPAEIERVVHSFGAVADAAVIGVPDETWGEVGKLFVVPHDNIDLNSEDLLEFCRKKLAKYKIPKHISFLREIPKNETGKVNRKALALL